MGLSNTYLVDRARIKRVQPFINAGVISKENARKDSGDWIRARLTPVSGAESREEGQVKLPYSYTLVLSKYDESGNEVCIKESDEFEVRVNRNGELTSSLENVKITGAVQEIRKRTYVTSYVVQVSIEDEF